MIVDPYVRTPVPPTVALLTRDGAIVDEHGSLVDPDDWPADVRAFTDYDTVRARVEAGHGEALRWNGEEIRWRHARLDRDGWTVRRSDVSVIRVPFGESERATLDGLASWRDWLAREGAAPTGTAGSASMSLLRATLEKTLFCSFGEMPPLRQTFGGRVQLGPAGPGAFEGDLVQLDLPSAYARTLAGLCYGGRWFNRDAIESGSLEHWASRGLPVFVAAKVRVPSSLEYGPLLRRPRSRLSQLALFFSQLYEDRYPVGRTLSGFWTWQELDAAMQAGVKVLQIRDWWLHLATREPFLPWWEAVERGRRRPGLAGRLAKITGNALWGRFCMDPAAEGERSISRMVRGRRRSFVLTGRRGAPRPAHDLAETVSGRVRALLYAKMVELGPRLVSAHTDGVWASADYTTDPYGGLHDDAWRVKQQARRLELLDPQTLRYWPSVVAPWEPGVVYAGVPAGQAGEMFERDWQRYLEAKVA